jgi:hypothetical protein
MFNAIVNITYHNGVLYFQHVPQPTLEAIDERDQATQAVVQQTQQSAEATRQAEPTSTPLAVPQYIENGDQRSAGYVIDRFYDAQAGVVCWRYHANFQGGLSCLPISETHLRPDDFGGAMKWLLILPVLALALAACSAPGPFAPYPTPADLLAFTWTMLTDWHFWLVICLTPLLPLPLIAFFAIAKANGGGDGQ